MTLMPWLAMMVFVSLLFVKAGYGIFRSARWGLSLPNKIGWMLMEMPAVVMMLGMWLLSPERGNAVAIVFVLLFEIHYVQRTFVFPFLMRGRSRMPVAIMVMGFVFNVVNGFLLGYGLFHLGSCPSPEWFSSPWFLAGLAVFIAGMAINLHSDNVIRHLRPRGDTHHYMPQKGMYRWVTSANYLGELLEWVGFALLTSSEAAWVFALWTFANLCPRAIAIRRRYVEEFGADVVGNKKCLIPFIL